MSEHDDKKPITDALHKLEERWDQMDEDERHFDRQSAAIALGVPRSGDKKIDAMIIESLRLGCAGRIVQGILTNPSIISPGQLKAGGHHEKVIKLAWKMTDMMLTEWSKSDG